MNIMWNWLRRKKSTPTNQPNGLNTSQPSQYISGIETQKKPGALPLKTTPPLAPLADTRLHLENQEQRLAIDLAVTLLKDFEGFSPVTYRCSADKLTIGYGRTIGVKEGDKVDRDDEEAWLKHHVMQLNEELQGLDLNRYQRAALLSLIYNIGAGAFRKSTLLRKLQIFDYDGAAKEFSRWNKAGGKVVNGLTIRRRKESELFNMKG